MMFLNLIKNSTCWMTTKTPSTFCSLMENESAIAVTTRRILYDAVYRTDYHRQSGFQKFQEKSTTLIM